MPELTAEQIEFVSTSVTNTLRHALIAPKIFSTLGVGEGVKTYGYDTETEMGAAAIVPEGGLIPQGTTELSRSSVDTWMHGKAFVTTFQSLAASQRSGMPLDARWGAQAARRVAELIDDTILLGRAAPLIRGLENAVGANTAAAAATWDNASAEPYNDVNDAMVELEEDDVPLDNLFLIAPRNVSGLLRRRSATQEVILREQIGDIIGGVDRIVTSSRITQTQAMLVAANPENIQIIESKAVNITGPVEDLKTKSFYWDVNWIGTPVIYHPTAICYITGVA